MKKIGLVLCFLLGSVAATWAAHISPFSYGQRYGLQQLDFYSIFIAGTLHVFTIASHQNTTGNDNALFNQTYPFEFGYGEYGRAYEFVVNGEGGGGLPWSTAQNDIFVLENGVGDSELITDIYGNVGDLVFNVQNNPLLWNQWQNFTAVDGDFDYGISNSQGNTQFQAVVFSYLTDGDSTVPGDFFDMTVSDGTHSFTINFLCNSGGTSLTQAIQVTPSIFSIATHANITVSFSNTANCDIAMPEFQNLSLFFAYTNAP